MSSLKDYFKKVESGTMESEDSIFQEWAQQIEAWRKLTPAERREKAHRAEECINCCWMSLDYFAQCLCPEPCSYANGDTKNRKSYFRPIDLKPYLKELSPIWRNVCGNV